MKSTYILISILHILLFWGNFVNASTKQIEFLTYDSIKLNASLHTPISSKEKMPAVLIIEGSGKSKPGKVVDDSPFVQLANKLSENGAVALRYNKRGSGENSDRGSFWKSTFTIDNKDAQSALDFLLSQKGIDKDNVFIIGHSFGGPQSLNLAEKNKIKKIIFLTSTVQSTDKLMLEQNEIIMKLQGLPEKDVQKNIEELKLQLASVKLNILKCDKPSCEVIDGVPVLDQSIQVPWLHDVLNLNFLKIAKDQPSPILFIFGNSDFVIPLSEQNFVKGELVSKNSEKYKSVVIEKLDHFMVENTSKEESLKYAAKAKKENKFKPISEQLVKEILSWMELN